MLSGNVSLHITPTGSACQQSRAGLNVNRGYIWKRSEVQPECIYVTVGPEGCHTAIPPVCKQGTDCLANMANMGQNPCTDWVKAKDVVVNK